MPTRLGTATHDDKTPPVAQHSIVFSQRTAWPRSENALTKATEALKAEAGGDLIDLTASNPTSLGLEYDAHRLCEALSHPEALTYRPKPLGLDAARQAISRYYERRK